MACKLFMGCCCPVPSGTQGHKCSSGGALPTLGAWRSPEKASGVPDTPPGEHSRIVQKCCVVGKHKCMCIGPAPVGDRGRLGTKLELVGRGRLARPKTECEQLTRKHPNQARAVRLPFMYILCRD
ncbi:hypothetical protein mRhiFer1_009866 [Rhinolophus ferrumequinum]|uniref:Uncharacterized protein n=1 Tax=Rhinolophus ferrumequinum TaxID=59479 RepID=A0A7J7YS53_RHIFE|nr:hypothetical protein mRhiFer1_009866 [Rhinolophus ferrumequinum]